MKVFTIDCAGIHAPRDLHQAIAREMGFPDWYGNNLDALHDVLTAIGEDTALNLLHFDALPPFSSRFRRVMEDAAEENPCLYVTFA